MKNLISLSLLVVLIAACGSKDDVPVDNGTGDGGNTAPTAPALTTPTNECVTNPAAVNFYWLASYDKESNPITYTVEVSESSTFAEIAKSGTGTDASLTLALEAGKKYYWRAKAKDDKGLEGVYSSTLNFTTAASEINKLPNAPVLVAPAQFSTVTTDDINLTWTCSDPDGDKLVFDVYRNENGVETKIATALEEPTFKITLTGYVEYAWYVIARDTKGGETRVDTWQFVKVAP